MVTQEKQFEVTWVDMGREPKSAPNPAYPDGIDLDISGGRLPSCLVALEHPAPRCGIYIVKCRLCDWSVALTTAGRADDPRTLRLDCRLNGKGEKNG